MKRNPTNAAQRGYSLAEILVAVAVFAIVMVAALAIYDQSNRVFKRGVEAADMQQNVRIAFEKLVADLRMAGYDHDRDGIPTGSAGFVWQPNRVYSIGDLVSPSIANGFAYRLSAVTGVGSTCTSMNPGPPAWSTTVGNIVNDNTCRWRTEAGVNQYQQPDEQIEFAGPTAIALRANFDYETDVANGNGREPALESAQFPVVTTGNDELVVYALRSVRGPNPHSIVFFADIGTRNAYPGGAAEDTVTIPTVDLGVVDITSTGCSATSPCYRFNNPPYTLYRFTLDPADNSVVTTPMATNIRSLNFQYYTNVTGTTTGAAPQAGWATETQLTSPGGGQFNPVLPTSGQTERLARAIIRSLRVTIIGMSESPEGNYRNPLESATSPARLYRTYRLESLIVPRNLGKQGVREIPPAPPGAPSIQSIEYGHCGAIKLNWLAPPQSSGTGPVESYVIQYNVASGPAGVFPFVNDAGAANSGVVSGLDPNTTYRFTVMALNSYGNQVALTSGGAIQTINATPRNATTPGAPTNLAGTGGAAGAAQPNVIVLSWNAPATNVGPNNMITTQLIGGGTSTAPGNPVAGEVKTYKVYRSTTANFTPVDTGNPGANEISTAAPNSLVVSGNTVTFTDKTVLNCIPYYYRVRAIERCGETSCAGCNVGTAVGISETEPAPGTDGALGRASALAPPAKPATLIALPGSDCTGLDCDIDLEWPKVKKDTSGPPAQDINVSDYVITRQRYVGGVLDTDSSLPAGPPVVTINFTDPAIFTGATVNPPTDTPRSKQQGTNAPYMYRYTVRARQCPDTSVSPTTYMESAESPELWIPCTFTGTSVTVDVSLTMDGDGMSPASAWLTNNPASQVVVDGTGLSKVQALLRSGAQTIDLGTSTTSPYTFPLTNTDVGEVYELLVIATDVGGCATYYTRYVEEATASGCCLATSPPDTTLVSYTPGQTFVDITFKNLCGQQLDVSQVILVWDPVIAGNSSATTLTNIEFPSTGTGTAVRTINDTAAIGATGRRTVTTTPPTLASPPARTLIDEGSSTYVIRVNFSKILSNSNSPVVSTCVVYRRPGIDDTDQLCRILPPPTSFNSCN